MTEFETLIKLRFSFLGYPTKIVYASRMENVVGNFPNIFGPPPSIPFTRTQTYTTLSYSKHCVQNRVSMSAFSAGESFTRFILHYKSPCEDFYKAANITCTTAQYHLRVHSFTLTPLTIFSS